MYTSEIRKLLFIVHYFAVRSLELAAHNLYLLLTPRGDNRICIINNQLTCDIAIGYANGCRILSRPLFLYIQYNI